MLALVSTVVLVGAVAFGLLDTFPQIDSWRKLAFWTAAVFLSIPAYILLAWMFGIF